MRWKLLLGLGLIALGLASAAAHPYNFGCQLDPLYNNDGTPGLGAMDRSIMLVRFSINTTEVSDELGAMASALRKVKNFDCQLRLDRSTSALYSQAEGEVEGARWAVESLGRAIARSSSGHFSGRPLNTSVYDLTREKMRGYDGWGKDADVEVINRDLGTVQMRLHVLLPQYQWLQPCDHAPDKETIDEIIHITE